MDDERGTREHGWPGAGEDSGTRPFRRAGSPLAGPGGERRQASAPYRSGTGLPGRRHSRGKRRKARSWWVELPILLVFALVLALLIKSFLIQAFYIPSSSMEDTLLIGDKVLVNKLVYDFRPIHRGDIVVFNGEGSWNPAPLVPTPAPERLWKAVTGLFGTAPGVHDYIKRVIGVPGDHVACCNARGQVTVNGVALSEKSYLYPGDAPSTMSFHVTVPPGNVWVMGDHRSVSYDSRGHRGDPGGGAIPEDKVVGRAFVIVWPARRWRVLPIPATFDQPRLAAEGPGLSHPAGPAALAAPGTPAQPSGPLAPLALGFTGAIPLNLLQRRARRRLARRMRARPRTGRRWAARALVRTGRAARALVRTACALARCQRPGGPGRW